MKLFRYALGLLGLTFALLIVGGLVHNTRSSLACPDWPLCFGSAFPKMEGGVLVEHSHRLLASSVGLGTIGLLFGLRRRARRTRDPRLFHLGILALLLVCVQGLLGGITVIYRLPTLVSTAHLGTSMLFFCLLIYLVFRLRPTAVRPPPASDPALVRASAIAAVLLYLQMLLGALMRHLGAGLACTDLPLCAGGVWPSSAHPNVLLHATHRLLAPLLFVVVCCVAVLAWRGASSRAMKLTATLAPLLILVQATLGWWSVSSFLDTVPVTLHLGVAALLLADLVSLHLLSRGRPRTAMIPRDARLDDSLELPRGDRVMPVALDAEAAPTTRLADLVALGKPRITFMVLVTALGAMWLAPMKLEIGPTLLALFGITLVVYGANALNMYLERDVDALMARTASRPLPAGRMHPEVALRAGIAASVLAVGLLTFGVNPLTGLLASLSLLLYVLVYTPWKRHTTLALLVGAIPGAAPPLLGWTAVMGRIDPGGLALFTILFIWQIPHFHAISIFRREDYVRAGLKIMPSVRGLSATKSRIVLYAAVLGAATLPAYAAGLSTAGYLWVAAPLSFAFLLLSMAGLRSMDDAATRRWARRVFFATILHLPIVLGALAYFRR